MKKPKPSKPQPAKAPPRKSAGAAAPQTNPQAAALAAILAKTYGPGVISIGSEAKGLRRRVVSTGDLGFDAALRGGLTINSPVAVWGPHNAGKTAFALSTARQWLTNAHASQFEDYDGTPPSVLWVAMEPFDTGWAARCGVPEQDYVLSQPASGEEAFDVIRNAVDNTSNLLVVLDSARAVSVTAQVAEQELSTNSAQPGTASRALTRGLQQLWKRVRPELRKDVPKCSLLIIQHAAMRIGISFGNPMHMPGGEFLLHFCPQRLRLTRSNEVRVGGKKGGAFGESEVAQYTSTMLVERDKTGGYEGESVTAKFCRVDCEIGPGGRFSEAAAAFTMGVHTGVLAKEGNTYSFEGGRIGAGVNAVEIALYNDPALLHRVQAAIKGKLGM